jgi:cytochrome c biogenesis protein
MTDLKDGADWTVTQDREVEEVAPGRADLVTAISFVRRTWRGLTSMRTALVLLFLLAVAAIPGSLLPQRNLNIEKVNQYLTDHPTLGPWLDRFYAFGVFASPWFAAIYLLLFVSLVGCLFPRLRSHVAALRRVPPDAPARLTRLPVSASFASVGPAAETADRLRGLLRARRYRTVVRPDGDGFTVSAEKGYLKETGNLLFHFSLMALLIGVAFGSWYGWHADRLIVAGDEFCSTVTQFDDYGLGARLSPADIAPFCVKLDDFDATYSAAGQPLSYAAPVSYTLGDSTSSSPYRLKVNDPLRLPGANVYLLGHGYAPILKFTDRFGHSFTSSAAFTPTDALLTSEGAVVFRDGVNVDPATGTNRDPKTYIKQQVGFNGFFIPTAADGSATSVFPAANDPMVVLTPYVGDLGVDDGVPQSVYQLNQAQIDRGVLTEMAVASPGEASGMAPARLRLGQTATLADGSTVQFVGFKQWASVTMRHDPGEQLVLAGAIALFIGLLLSLTGRRRRIWFRVSAGSDVKAGGLARAEYASFPVEFEALVAAAREPQEE